jgi:uncharacterized protein DUF1353
MRPHHRPHAGWLALLVIAASGLRPAAQQPIQPVPFMPFADGNDSMVITDLTYIIGTTNFRIVVPAGFVTDFASIPRVFWSVLPTTGNYQLAAVVHDFLYWDQGCTREQADQLLRAAMIESRVETLKREIIFEAVRRGGEGAWTINAAEKAAGKPRVVPAAFRTIPALMTWATYRNQLMAAGTRPDPSPATPPTYCAAAGAVTPH